MALQPSIRVINGRVFGAYAAQAKNVAYGQGTVEDALDEINESVAGVEDALDSKLNVSWRTLIAGSWQYSGDHDTSFFNVPNVATGFAPIAKIVNSDGSFKVYGFLSDGLYKATFNSSGVYQSNTKIG
jgi:hypothetical protein